ncbi:MAG: hypothetical protein ACRERS_00735 [Methylococcales bacterium]
MKNWVYVMMAAMLIDLTGCASEKKRENMDAALRLYEQSIRWGSYTDAQLALENPQSQEQLDSYKDIKVISYEVKSQEIVGDFEQLNQIVDIKFYHEQQGVIQTLRDVQVWLYDQDRNGWVLKTGLPDFLSVFR